MSNHFSEIELKSCLGTFATGVTVVTTIDTNSKNMYGITVNSFNSVSLKPPMILFSIEKEATRFSTFNDCEYFVVNILNEKQKYISEAFAKLDTDIWEKINYFLVRDIPIIEEALSYFLCKKLYSYEGGDHKIIVGEILDLEKLNQGQPLIYYGSKYHAIGEDL